MTLEVTISELKDITKTMKNALLCLERKRNIVSSQCVSTNYVTDKTQQQQPVSAEVVEKKFFHAFNESYFRDGAQQEAILAGLDAIRPYLAAMQPDQSQAREYGWLIESCMQDERGPYYLCVRKLRHSVIFDWKPDNQSAIRFTRKIDAENTRDAIRELVPDLFPEIVPMPKAVEHCWITQALRAGSGEAV